MDSATSRRHDLRTLTSVDIRKAFEKVEHETNIKNSKLILITSEYYDHALQLLKDHFVHDEPMAIAFDMQWDIDAEHFWRGVYNEDLSIGLCEEDTGKLIAIRGIKVIVDGSDPEGNDDQHIMDERLMQGLTFMKYCDEQSKFFQHFKTDCAIQFLGLVVHDRHRNKGFASQLFEAALNFVQNLGVSQVVVKGEGSSIFSQKIYEKFGFEKIYEKVFADYGKENNIALKDTGEHLKYVAYGKCYQAITV
ncbi:hypothetical protein ACF0H5_021463 [Mactra antiquata]